MNEREIVFLLTVILGALPLMIIGFLIAVKNKGHWINGVDQSKLKNPVAFVKYVGNSIGVTGILFALIAIFLYLGIIGYLLFAISLTVVSFLPLPCLYIAKIKYS